MELKHNDKSTFLKKNGVSDVAFASVYSDKTRLKKLLMKMISITSNTKTIH